MNKQEMNMSNKDWIKYHYDVESDFAKRILQSLKNSDDRVLLFKDSYNEIEQIFQKYKPGGGETDYTDVVVSIIKKRLRKESSVLDIGCASGNLIMALTLNGYDARGIDVSSELIKTAKKRLQTITKSNLIINADFLRYAIERTFDCVVLDNVIEHFHPDDISDILEKCHKIVNENGYIIILTPHRFSGPHDISKHFVPLGSKAMGFHLKEFSFTELHDLLKLAGFNKVFGFPFHPRLFRHINVIPNCSTWAGQKAIFAEKAFQSRFIAKVLSINATLSRGIVALLFPSVCVAKKERSYIK